MIFIVVKFTVLEQYTNTWLEQTRSFTEATRNEAGNLWFDWSVNVENPSEYVLVEAFADDKAGSDHVRSEHFREGIATMRPLLSETPRIIHTVLDQEGWSEMGELAV